MIRWSTVFLVGCAHSIAALPAGSAPPVPAPLPAAASSVRACWVEYASSGKYTASGIAVKGPGGVVLVDAGESTKFRTEILEVQKGRFYLKLVPAKLIPDRPASEVLQAAGVDPAALVAFVPTHAHSDHLGGLMDLPAVPIRMDPVELEVLKKVAAGDPGWFNILPAEARKVVPEAVAFTWSDTPVEGFPRSVDLVGDGTVVVVPLAGHTPGSVGVLISAGSRRVLAAGDAINTRSQLDRLKGKSPILQPTDNDPDLADAVVGQLAALHTADPGLFVLPAHERQAWVDLFGAPGGCL